MSEFISLYDFLGKAAGSTLGKQVADYAASKKVPHKIRHVSNPKYTGEIMLYPAEFLNEFFNSKLNPDYTEINTQLIEDSFKQDDNRIY